MNSVQTTTLADAMRTYPNVPMKYVRQIVASTAERPMPKYVLPSSPVCTARRSAIDWLINELHLLGSKSETANLKNTGRFKAYNKLQAKLLSCISNNKPVKVSLLDNMACILANMAKVR